MFGEIETCCKKGNRNIYHENDQVVGEEHSQGSGGGLMLRHHLLWGELQGEKPQNP